MLATRKPGTLRMGKLGKSFGSQPEQVSNKSCQLCDQTADTPLTKANFCVTRQQSASKSKMANIKLQHVGY